MKNAIRLATVFLALTAASFAGVTVSSPTNGATTNSPLHVVAAASPNSASAKVAVMQVYVDGRLAYQGDGAHLDTYLNIAAGHHQLAIKSWDTSGVPSVKALAVNGTGVGIFLSSPGANATLNGSAHVKATAVSRTPITAMHLYDNGDLADQVSSGSLDTTINLTPGSHYLVVQAWNEAGKVFISPVTVHVPGAPAPALPQAQPATGPATSNANQPAAQANIPSGATAKTNIDQMGGWESCDSCAGINGSGPVDPYSMTQKLKSPSLDGNAAAFWLGGKVPWGAALWWKQLGPDDKAKHFVYDVHFYVNKPQVAQGLEFDVNQSVGGQKYIFGTECDVRTNGGWRVWDTQHARWMKTGVSCQVNANSWNHLTWEFERVGNQTHFIAVTLNGYRQVVNKYYYAKPVGNAREINVAFQMDGDEHEDNYQAWLDKVTLYYW